MGASMGAQSHHRSLLFLSLFPEARTQEGKENGKENEPRFFTLRILLGHARFRPCSFSSDEEMWEINCGGGEEKKGFLSFRLLT